MRKLRRGNVEKKNVSQLSRPHEPPVSDSPQSARWVMKWEEETKQARQGKGTQRLSHID